MAMDEPDPPAPRSSSILRRFSERAAERGWLELTVQLALFATWGRHVFADEPWGLAFFLDGLAAVGAVGTIGLMAAKWKGRGGRK